MANKILFRRGNKAQLPTLAAGEPALCLDTKQVFVGTNSGNIQLVTSTEMESANHTHSNKSVLDGITAAKITTWNGVTGKAAKSVARTATLTTAGWTGTAAPYAQTVSVTGVTTTSANEVLPSLTITAAQLEAMQAANLQDGGQAAGKITVKAWGDKPTIDLPIRVIVRGDL